MRDSESNPPRSVFNERVILTVTELTQRLKRVIERDFRDIEVQGEISNFKQHQSGHWYFTLKDSGAQIRAVFYSTFNRLLRFELENGLEVRVRGRIAVYEPRGEYQILVDIVAPLKTGELQLAFEQMRKRLAAEGLFDQARKRKLPLLPRRVGVVTSLDGAVSRDIVKVLGRRHPSLPIVIVPVRVQGGGAAAEIADAIRFFNQRAQKLGREVDVIILARGGGSIEDLWAFNEEIVARAIFASKVPIVSAVGHETDITIADLVADVRAATPSAAAELVAPAADDLRARVDGLQYSLRRVMDHFLLRRRSRLHDLISSRAFTNTESRLGSLASSWRDLEARMLRAFQQRLDTSKFRVREAGIKLAATDLRALLLPTRSRVESLDQALARALDRDLERRKSELAVCAGQLDMLSPLKVLGRGYLLAQRTSGSLVTQAKELVRGDRLRLLFVDGQVGCEIIEAAEPRQTPK